MIYKIKPEMLTRLLDATEGTLFRLHAETTVGLFFKSTRYRTSKRLVDGIVLNMLLNDEITPKSGDEILTYIQSKTRSFYKSVEHDYKSIEDRFLYYAATIVDNLDEILALNMRPVNFVVYILSKDISKRVKLDRDEVYSRALSYREIIKNKIPKY